MTTAGRLTPTAGTTTFAARPAPAPGQRRLPAAGTPYQLAAGEGPAVWFLGNLVTWKATGDQTHGRLTIAEFAHPAGFGPPLHRHLHEDEIFYILSGTAEFYCKGERLRAAAGDLVLLPAGEPHTFLAGDDAPLRTLQITTPAGFEHFAAAAGTPAGKRHLPGPAQPGPAALGHVATAHGIEILASIPVRAGRRRAVFQPAQGEPLLSAPRAADCHSLSSSSRQRAGEDVLDNAGRRQR